MHIIFWGLTIEISRALNISLENVKISLLGTVQPFIVVYMLYFFCTEEMWNNSMRYFFYL